MSDNPRDDLDNYDGRVKAIMESSLSGMDALINDAKEDTAKISESVFKRKILPIMTNWEGKQNLYHWHDIAGHALRPIDVYHDTTREFLFRVPPVLRSFRAVRKRPDAPSTYEVMKQSEQKRRVLPAAGDKHLTEQMAGGTVLVKKPGDDIQQWNNILKRYGMNFLDVQKEEDTQEQEKQPETDIFTGEYDDL